MPDKMYDGHSKKNVDKFGNEYANGFGAGADGHFGSDDGAVANSFFGSFDDDVFEALPPIPKKYLREFSPDTETPLIEIGKDDRIIDPVSVQDSGERSRDRLSDDIPPSDMLTYGGHDASDDTPEARKDHEKDRMSARCEDTDGNTDKRCSSLENVPIEHDGGETSANEDDSISDTTDSRSDPGIGDVLPQTGGKGGWRGIAPAPVPTAGQRQRSAADEEISELFARLRSRSGSGQHRENDTDFSIAVPRSSSFRDTGLIRSYEPRHPFLRHVDILTWPSSYTFYERFRADAVSFFSREGREVPYAEFVSYVPQYSMMTGAQLSYYFYWRSCMRAGRLIKASRSYVLLFIYEVINLPDLIAPTDGVRQLCRVITGYAETVIGVRNSVIPWLRDYCLIHGVSLPEEYMRDIAAIAGRYTALPEFFVCYNAETGKADPLSLASVLSHYSWQESKYMTAAARSCYERHMPAAIAAAMAAMGTGTITDGIPQRYIAESYSGAVCSSEVKCRLRIDYIRASDCADSEAVTVAVKYAENQVRRLLGIKSRFKISALPSGMRDAIDLYFEPVFAREESMRRTMLRKTSALPEVAPEYEHFYAPESSGMSFDRALEIERRSWRMTERLEEAFSEDAEASAHTGKTDADNADERDTALSGMMDDAASNADYMENAGSAVDAAHEAENNGASAASAHGTAAHGTDKLGVSGRTASSSPEIAGLRLLLNGDSAGFELCACAAALLPEALCDRINELLYDDVGDSTAEHTAAGYSIIEDYRDEAEEYLRRYDSGEVC